MYLTFNITDILTWWKPIHPVTGQLWAVIRPIVSPWSSVRNFTSHPLPPSNHVVSNISSTVDVALSLGTKNCAKNHHRDATMLYVWRHIHNISSNENPEFNTLRDVETTGKYWVNFVVLQSRDKIKLCSYAMWSTRLPEGSQWLPGWPHYHNGNLIWRQIQYGMHSKEEPTSNNLSQFSNSNWIKASQTGLKRIQLNKC